MQSPVPLIVVMANPVLFTNVALMRFPWEHDFDCRRLCQYILAWHLNPITHLLVKSIWEQRSSVPDALEIVSVRFCTHQSQLIPSFRLVNKPLTKQKLKHNENKTCEDIMNPKQTVKSYLTILYVMMYGRSEWPRGLRHEMSSPVRTLGSWVRIPLKAWISVCVCSVFVLCSAALRRADPPPKGSYRLS
jgi:hypothetical protein